MTDAQVFFLLAVFFASVAGYAAGWNLARKSRRRP